MKLATMFAAPLALAALTLAAAPEITIKTDKAMPLYKVGEPVTFTVSALDNGKPLTKGTFAVKLTEDGGTALDSKVVDLTNPESMKFTAKLDRPGFIRAATADYKDMEAPAKAAMAGAGFEPEKIKMGYDLPADFTKFWEDGRKAIADKPVTLTKIDAKSDAKQTAYRVVVDVLNGEKLYGFLSVPNGKGPFPAIVTVPGAGPGAPGPNVRENAIYLTMNVHKFDGALKSEDLRKQYDDNLAKLGYSYSVDQADNRDKYHFRNVILGVDRAITEVTKMPQWDKKHFVIDGSSQGGAMALILTGFNKNITACAANVPAMCDHGGYKLGRQSGWPQINRNSKFGKSVDQVAPYYDAANFAKFITVPVLTSAGFIDGTCSPSSVYAAYNEIKAPKQIVNTPVDGHTVTKIYTAIKTPWVNKEMTK
ncbi:MAG: acetylxylan esterase [Victivallaceae bacterium]